MRTCVAVIAVEMIANISVLIAEDAIVAAIATGIDIDSAIAIFGVVAVIEDAAHYCACRC